MIKLRSDPPNEERFVRNCNEAWKVISTLERGLNLWISQRPRVQTPSNHETIFQASSHFLNCVLHCEDHFFTWCLILPNDSSKLISISLGYPRGQNQNEPTLANIDRSADKNLEWMITAVIKWGTRTTRAVNIDYLRVINWNGSRCLLLLCDNFSKISPHFFNQSENPNQSQTACAILPV